MGPMDFLSMSTDTVSREARTEHLEAKAIVLGVGFWEFWEKTYYRFKHRYSNLVTIESTRLLR